MKIDALFKDQRPMGALQGAPIILNLREFFTDCFQNLAQRFIGMLEYVNDIVLKKVPGAPWGRVSLRPPGGPQNLKFPKI